MIEIAFHRRLSEVFASSEVRQGSAGRDRAADGKIKAPTSVGRMWLVGWRFSAACASRLLALFCEMHSDINDSSAVARYRAWSHSHERRDDDLRIRPGRIRDTDAARPDQRALSARSCGPRGRPGIPARDSAGRDRAVRSRSAAAARGAGPVAALAGRRVVDQGARRPSSRQALPLGAARQAHRPISSARASPATAPTPGCSMRDSDRSPMSRRSPSDARMIGIISGSSSRRRTRARWPTCEPSRAS